MGKEFIKEIKLKKLFIVFILMSIIAFSQVKSDIVKMKNIAESKSFFDLGIQHIASMSVDSLGNLFIIDGMKRKILKFDTKLKYISSFGKQGQGPGEFNRAYTISIDKKNNLYIMDNMNKIITYSNSGKLINEKRFSGGTSSSSGFVLNYPVFISRKYKNMQPQIVLINLEKGEVVKEFEVLVSANYSLKMPNGMRMAPTIEYVGGHSFIDTFNDHCVIAEGEKINVRLIDSSGKVLVIKKDKIEKSELSSKEIDYLKDKIFLYFGGKFSKTSLVKLLSNYKYKNFIYNVKIADNRVYVFTVASDISVRNKYPVEIYDFKGKLIKKSYFPFVPKKIYGNYVYKIETIEEDDEEIQKIVKYRF